MIQRQRICCCITIEYLKTIGFLFAHHEYLSQLSSHSKILATVQYRRSHLCLLFCQMDEDLLLCLGRGERAEDLLRCITIFIPLMASWRRVGFQWFPLSPQRCTFKQGRIHNQLVNEGSLMVNGTQCCARSDQMNMWIDSRKAVAKGQCPVGQRGKSFREYISGFRLMSQKIKSRTRGLI